MPSGKVKKLFGGLRDRLRPSSSPHSSRGPSPTRPISPAPAEPGSNKLKDAGSMVWNTAQTALRLLEKNADGFPPLKIAVSVLVTCLDLTQHVMGNKEEYQKLAAEFGDMASLLAPYAQKLVAGDAGGSVALILGSIDKELTEIKNQLDRGKFKRAIEATEDQDDVIKRYRKIDSLFRRLLSDVTLRTHVEIGKLREATEATLLRTLSPVDDARYNSSYSTAVKRRGCTAETREQILDNLKIWVDNPSSAKIFWMNGMAGTGKTTILYSFCQWLEEHERLGGNFFCSRTSAACRDLNNIVRSIAYQLAHYSPAFRSQLCEILEAKQNPHMLNVGEQFKWVMEQPLQKAKDAIPEGAVIVIDALDECDNSSSTALFLDTLIKFAASLPIKFMVASRPEPVIQEKMQAPRFSPSVLRLHEIEQSLVEADIKKYFLESFTTMSPAPSPGVVDQLTERSGKLFIYAATVVRYVNPEGVKVNSSKRLQIILGISSSSASLRYQELDKLYMTILAAAFDETVYETEEMEIATLILRTVICAIEPMTMQTLSTILTLDQGEVKDTLFRFRSVLHLQEEHSGLVSVLHASFPDFLFDKSRSMGFYCNVVAHSYVLAGSCFDLMAKELHFNICDLESSFLFDKDVPDLKQKVKNKISNALIYTCKHWSNHLIKGNLTNEIHLKLVNFLHSYLLFWMEVLNLTKHISMGSRLLLNALNWLKAHNYGFKETEKKLHDADLFVKTFSIGACKQSTPHIYISALPFCFKSSFVYQTYWKQTQGLVAVNGSSVMQKNNRPIGVWKTDSVINAVAFSPNGSTFISGSQDGSVCIWDANSGDIVSGPFVEHTHYVVTVAFSPDNSKIASGSYDCTICVWDVQTGNLIAGPLKKHQHFVFSIAFSPDSSQLVSGSGDGTIIVWDSTSGDIITGPFQSTDEVQSVAFTPDATNVLSVSADKMIHVWNAKTGDIIAGPFEAAIKSSLYFTAFSPDGTKVAMGFSNNTIWIWNAYTGTVVSGPFVGHTSFVSALIFSSDGKKLISGAHDYTIRVWDAYTGDILAEPFEGHTGSIQSLSLSQDGTKIVSGSFDQSICVWNAPTSETPISSLFKSITSGIHSVAFSPEGNRIVSGSNDGQFAVWNAQTGNAIIGPFKGHKSCIYSVAFSPDGSKVLTGSGEHVICQWDAKTGKMVGKPFEGHTSYIYTIAYSPDNTKIASGSGDNTIIIWDAITGCQLGNQLNGHTNDVWTVVFSPDSTRLASGGSDRIINVWDINSRKIIIGPIKEHTGYIHSIAFSNDGEKFVSGSQDSTLCIWNAKTGDKMAGPLEGHSSYVESVAFSPDNTTIISGGLDNIVCIWDAETGKLLFKLFNEHTGPIMSVAISPDGAKAISGSADRSIRIWILRDFAQKNVSSPAIIKAHFLEENLSQSVVWDPHKMNSAISNISTYQEDGWMKIEDMVLLWTSPEFRQNLCFPHNPIVIGPHGSTSIDFSSLNLCIGRKWIKCWLK